MVESPHSGSLISKNLQTQTIGIINEKEENVISLTLTDTGTDVVALSIFTDSKLQTDVSFFPWPTC